MRRFDLKRSSIDSIKISLTSRLYRSDLSIFGPDDRKNNDTSKWNSLESLCGDGVTSKQNQTKCNLFDRRSYFLHSFGVAFHCFLYFILYFVSRASELWMFLTIVNIFKRRQHQISTQRRHVTTQCVVYEVWTILFSFVVIILCDIQFAKYRLLSSPKRKEKRMKTNIFDIASMASMILMIFVTVGLGSVLCFALQFCISNINFFFQTKVIYGFSHVIILCRINFY